MEIAVDIQAATPNRRLGGAGLRRGIRRGDGGGGSGPPVPVNTSPPTINADPQIGQVISYTPGTWTGTPSLSYEVYRGGVLIPGADQTYVYVAADIGPGITLRELDSVSGTSATSAPRAWTPETPGSLRCWLEDAFVLTDSDTLVEMWIDLSANSDADFEQITTALKPLYTASNPNFDGRPSIRTDGINDSLLSILAPSVWRFLHDGTGMVIAGATRTRTVPALGTLLSSGTTSAAVGLAIFQQSAADIWRFFMGNGTGFPVDNSTPGGSCADNTRYDFVTGHATAASPVQYFRTNGTQIDTQANNAVAPAAGDPTGTLRLFAIQLNNGSFLSIDAACFLFYNSDVRAKNADIEAWMAWRFT